MNPSLPAIFPKDRGALPSTQPSVGFKCSGDKGMKFPSGVRGSAPRYFWGILGVFLTFASVAFGAEILSGECVFMNTTVEIQVVEGAGGEAKAKEAMEKASVAMQELANVVNAWDEKSDAGKINANAGKVPVSVDPRLIHILKASKELGVASGGAFDITFFPLGVAWNVRGDDFKIPDAETVKKAKEMVDYRELVLDEKGNTVFLKKAGMRLELGAIAKGSIIDAGIQSLKANGVQGALIRGGGDMYLLGDKGGEPWRIGIQHPRGERDVLLGTVDVRGTALTTSGDYEKYKILNGKRYCHIVDPRTGHPAEKCMAVTVLGPSAEVADGLSTTLFVLGSKEGMELLKKYPGVEALFVEPDLRITKTKGFPEVNPAPQK
jgi:FAD:protein FMN transferase